MELFQKKTSKLDEPIERVLLEMDIKGPYSDKYDHLVMQLEQLLEMRRNERGTSKVSPDTMAVVVGNLLGILTIVAYEQKHVMVSKGLGLILRSKHTNQ
jgi:hypothetical protein